MYENFQIMYNIILSKDGQVSNGLFLTYNFSCF